MQYKAITLFFFSVTTLVSMEQDSESVSLSKDESVQIYTSDEQCISVPRSTITFSSVWETAVAFNNEYTGKHNNTITTHWSAEQVQEILLFLKLIESKKFDELREILTDYSKGKLGILLQRASFLDIAYLRNSVCAILTSDAFKGSFTIQELIDDQTHNYDDDNKQQIALSFLAKNGSYFYHNFNRVKWNCMGTLFACHDQNKLYIVEPITARHVYYDNLGEYSTIVWHPHNPDLLAINSSAGTYILDVSLTPPLRLQIINNEKRSCLVWHPTQKRIASTKNDARDLAIYVTDLWQKDTDILNGHTQPNISIAWHPTQSHILASTSHDKTIRIWDVTHKTCLQTFNLSQGGKSILWDPVQDNRVAVLCADNISLWDTTSEQCVSTIPCNDIDEIQWYPKQSNILIGKPHCLYVWDTKTGQELCVLKGHTACITSIIWHPTHFHILVTGSYDKTIRLWNIQTGECLSVLEGHTTDILSLAWHPLSTDILMSLAYADEKIYKWNVQNIVKSEGELSNNLLPRLLCLEMLTSHEPLPPADQLTFNKIWHTFPDKIQKVFTHYVTHLTYVSSCAHNTLLKEKMATIRSWFNQE